MVRLVHYLAWQLPTAVFGVIVRDAGYTFKWIPGHWGVNRYES